MRWKLSVAALVVVFSSVPPAADMRAGADTEVLDPGFGELRVIGSSLGLDGSLGLLTEVTSGFGAEWALTVIDDALSSTTTRSGISSFEQPETLEIMARPDGAWVAVLGGHSGISALRFADGETTAAHLAPTIPPELDDVWSTQVSFDDVDDPRVMIVSVMGPVGDFLQGQSHSFHTFDPDTLTIGAGSARRLGDGSLDPFGVVDAVRLESGDVLVMASSFDHRAQIRRYSPDLATYVLVGSTDFGEGRFVRDEDALRFVGETSTIEFDDAGNPTESSTEGSTQQSGFGGVPVLGADGTFARLVVSNGRTLAALLDTARLELGWQQLAVNDGPTRRDERAATAAMLGGEIVIVGDRGTVAVTSPIERPTAVLPLLGDLPAPAVQPHNPAPAVFGEPRAVWFGSGRIFAVDGVNDGIGFGAGGHGVVVHADCAPGPVVWGAAIDGARPLGHEHMVMRGDGSVTVAAFSEGLFPSWPEIMHSDGARFTLPTGAETTWSLASARDDRRTSLAVTTEPSGAHAWLLDASGAAVAGPVRVAIGSSVVGLGQDPLRDRWVVAAANVSAPTASVVVLDGADLRTVASEQFELETFGAVDVAVDPATGVVGVGFAADSYTVVQIDPSGSLQPVRSAMNARVVGAVVSDSDNGRFLVATSGTGTVDLHDMAVLSPGQPTPRLTLIGDVDAGPAELSILEMAVDTSTGRGILAWSSYLDGLPRLAPFEVGAGDTSCDLRPSTTASVVLPASSPTGNDTPLDLGQYPTRGSFDPSAADGYWLLTAYGEVASFGNAPHHGHASAGFGFNSFAAMEAHPSGTGYWTVTSTGGITAHGTARRHGEPATSDRSVMALLSTPTGDGYWTVDDSGAVTAFGDATHHGDLDVLADAARASTYIVDAVATPSGEGYWLLGGDGGIFAFGDARYHGSLPQVLGPAASGAGVTAMVPTPTGAGYWLVGWDGGVFAFGDAPFKGSVPGVLGPGVFPLGSIVSMVAYGDGYLMLGADGGVFNFSSKPFLGSLGGGIWNGFVDLVEVPR